MPAKILAVVGSMREGSRTRLMLHHILEQAATFGAETNLIDLGRAPLPIFHTPAAESDPNLIEATRLVEWADGIILGSPDYHGSMSGPMKNFLDHHWEEFAGKLFGYVVSSHEKGLTTQDQMRTAVRQCYGWSLPYGLGFNGDQAFDADNRLIDEPLQKRARMLARDMTTYAPLLNTQFQTDASLGKNTPNPSFASRFGK